MNFSLLIAAADKLEWLTGIPRTRYLVAIAVPLAFLLVWVLGWVMDVVVRSPLSPRLRQYKGARPGLGFLRS